MFQLSPVVGWPLTCLNENGWLLTQHADTLDEGTSKHAPYMSLQSEVAAWVERVA